MCIEECIRVWHNTETFRSDFPLPCCGESAGRKVAEHLTLNGSHFIHCFHCDSFGNISTMTHKTTKWSHYNFRLAFSLSLPALCTFGCATKSTPRFGPSSGFFALYSRHLCAVHRQFRIYILHPLFFHLPFNCQPSSFYIVFIGGFVYVCVLSICRSL